MELEAVKDHHPGWVSASKGGPQRLCDYANAYFDRENEKSDSDESSNDSIVDDKVRYEDRQRG